MSRYDEIVNALKELKGEAKPEDIHKKILETVGIKPPSKGTVGTILRNFQESEIGRKYSFHQQGKGVWKLVRMGPSRRQGKEENKADCQHSDHWSKNKHGCQDLPSFIEKIVEPLKKDGGLISITVEVIYRPKNERKESPLKPLSRRT